MYVLEESLQWVKLSDMEFNNIDLKRVKATFCLLLTLLTGCTATGLGGQKGSLFTGFEPVEDGAGQIYIYRPYKTFWLKAYPNVIINDELVGELRNGTYIVVNVPSGNHKIILPSNNFWAIPSMSTELEVEKGQRIFLRVGAKLDSVLPIYLGSFGVVSMTASAAMVHIKEDVASLEISKLLRSNTID